MEPNIVYNLNLLIENSLPFMTLPVNNKVIYDGNIKLMAIKGPNQREDFHIEIGEVNNL